MTIPNYTRPQSTIAQLLRVAPDRVVNRQNALIIGPQYKLVINDGRDIPGFAFAAAGASLGYKSVESDVTVDLDLAGYKVDTAGVKLFGEDLEAEIGSIDEFEATTSGAANRITLPNAGTQNVGGSGGGNVLHPNMDGRDVRVGDVLEITVDNSEDTPGVHVADETFYRKVAGLIPRDLTASVGSVLASATNFIAKASAALVATSAPTGHVVDGADLVINGDANQFFVTGGRFGTELGEELTITCTVPGAPGVAEYSVAYTAKGSSETIVSADDTGDFLLTLTEYDGSTLNLDLSGAAVTTAQVGDTYKVRIFPVHADNTDTTLTTSGVYTGDINTSYVVEVLKGSNNNAGVVSVDLRIYDTQDSDIIQEVTIIGTGSVPLGTKGLTLNIDTTAVGNPDFVTGDKFIFEVSSAGSSATEFVGLILDGAAFNPAAFNVTTGSFRVSVREPYTGEITADNVAVGDPFTADSDSTDYVAGLGKVTSKVTTPFAQFVDGRGEVIVSYRAVQKPSAVEIPIIIDEDTDLDVLGEENLLNDLAYGTARAFAGSQAEEISGRFVYALRTADDTVEAHEAALRSIESTDIYGFLVPMTDKEEIIDLYTTHVEEQSQPKRKNFRRFYFGTEVGGAYEFLGKRNDGTSRKATVSGDVLSLATEDATDTNFLLLNLNVGDEVRFATGSTHSITAILSATELQITDAPPAGITPASAFTIWKLGTAQDDIDYVKLRSQRQSSRRAVNVWVDTGLVGTEVIPSRFVAAEVAGIRSALLPQQGLTFTEIESVESAPTMYTKYTSDQLDEVAAAGVMVVTQESEGGAVFIRHQLTTETDEGILAWEDNVGVIVDFLSFQIKDSDVKFIGKKNVVQRTLEALENELAQIMINATQATLPENEKIGPMIINFSDEDGNLGQVTVRQDPKLADRVIRYVKVGIPVPLNNIDTTIDAEVGFVF